AAGNYFARVYSPTGTRAGYSLTFDTPALDPTTHAVKPDDWTVLGYMTAGNLADRAFADLNEMEAEANRLGGKANLAVLLDQSAALKTFATGNGSQPAWGTTGEGLITPDTDPTKVATRFTLLPEQDTGDPKTLHNFVKWATGVAPAQHYALVFWDHGD